VIDEAGLPPGNLELEITEGMLMGDVQRALAVLKELKAMGVIAIDDFGPAIHRWPT
jgi:EAL domain-containing protein (putative c-di-GMP-specific phosphodiesterase class I)